MIPLPVLALAATALAPAHLRTVYPRTGEVIAAAKALAVVRLVGEPSATPEGERIAAERLEPVAGGVPAKLEIFQRGHHRHPLKSGETILAPLTRSPAGRWIYDAETRHALRVDPGRRRAAAAFAVEWRARAARPPAERLGEWLGLTAHPVAIARRAAFEELLAHAPALGALVTLAQLDALLAVAGQPDTDEATQAAAFRVLEALGGRRAADLLARRFDALHPDRVKLRAVGVLGRIHTPAGREALACCAKEAQGAVAIRCQRVLARALAR